MHRAAVPRSAPHRFDAGMPSLLTAMSLLGAGLLAAAGGAFAQSSADPPTIVATEYAFDGVETE